MWPVRSHTSKDCSRNIWEEKGDRPPSPCVVKHVSESLTENFPDTAKSRIVAENDKFLMEMQNFPPLNIYISAPKSSAVLKKNVL